MASWRSFCCLWGATLAVVADATKTPDRRSLFDWIPSIPVLNPDEDAGSVAPVVSPAELASLMAGSKTLPAVTQQIQPVDCGKLLSLPDSDGTGYQAAAVAGCGDGPALGAAQAAEEETSPQWLSCGSVSCDGHWLDVRGEEGLCLGTAGLCVKQDECMRRCLASRFCHSVTVVSSSKPLCFLNSLACQESQWQHKSGLETLVRASRGDCPSTHHEMTGARRPQRNAALAANLRQVPGWTTYPGLRCSHPMLKTNQHADQCYKHPERPGFSAVFAADSDALCLDAISCLKACKSADGCWMIEASTQSDICLLGGAECLNVSLWIPAPDSNMLLNDHRPDWSQRVEASMPTTVTSATRTMTTTVSSSATMTSTMTSTTASSVEVASVATVPTDSGIEPHPGTPLFIGLLVLVLTLLAVLLMVLRRRCSDFVAQAAVGTPKQTLEAVPPPQKLRERDVRRFLRQDPDAAAAVGLLLPVHGEAEDPFPSKRWLYEPSMSTLMAVE